MKIDLRDYGEELHAFNGIGGIRLNAKQMNEERSRFFNEREVFFDVILLIVCFMK